MSEASTNETVDREPTLPAEVVEATLSEWVRNDPEGRIPDDELSRRISKVVQAAFAARAGAEAAEPGRFAAEVYAAADRARTDYLRDVDPNDQISALTHAVDAALWMVLGTPVSGGVAEAVRDIAHARRAAASCARVAADLAIFRAEKEARESVVQSLVSALMMIADSDDVDNALDPERNKRVARAAIENRLRSNDTLRIELRDFDDDPRVSLGTIGDAKVVPQIGCMMTIPNLDGGGWISRYVRTVTHKLTDDPCVIVSLSRMPK